MIRIVAAAAVIILTLTGCSADLGRVPDIFTPAGDVSSTAGNDNSDMTQEELYELMTSELRQFHNKVTMNGRIETQMITDVMDLVQRKAPDIFWIDGYTITSSGKKTEVIFEPIDGHTPAELQAMSEELSNAAEEIIASMPEGLMDYDRVLYVHDAIVRSTAYDQTGVDAGRNGIWGTAYGCLVNGRAICQGYSEAFVYMMNMLGIESGMCSGRAGTESHAWNYVRIGGDYYWIDVTWDDPESLDENDTAEGILRHTYFLINDDMLLRTRTIDPGQAFVPECSSIANNYFVRSGCYFDTYSIESLGWVMQRSGDERHVEIMFPDELTFSEAVSRLFDDGEIWELTDYVWLDDQISYSKDEVMYVLTISF